MKQEKYKKYLEYWEEQLKVADNNQREEYCSRQIAKYEYRVNHSEEFSGY